MHAALSSRTVASAFILSLLLLYTPEVRSQSMTRNSGDFSNQLQPKKSVPTDVILVKGASAQSSDLITALPEGGKVIDGAYTNAYFGLDFVLPVNWTKLYDGPPPSDSGSYVLVELEPADTFKGAARGTVLVTAEDLFFTPTGATNARELVDFSRSHLIADYKLEQAPTQVRFAGHSFIRFDYSSSVSGLHWRVLATQIRCHALQFVFTSRDPKLVETLMQEMSGMKLPEETGINGGSGDGQFPACIRDYANETNVIERADPILTQHRFNPVPVRVIIDTEGKIKHAHVLSGFPDQSKSIMEVLQHWKFKPFLHEGQPVEVETGILFGGRPRPAMPPLGISSIPVRWPQAMAVAK